MVDSRWLVRQIALDLLFIIPEPYQHGVKYGSRQHRHSWLVVFGLLFGTRINLTACAEFFKLCVFGVELLSLSSPEALAGVLNYIPCRFRAEQA